LPGRTNLSYDITGRWKLPSELLEVSAIDWLDNSRIAALQDEDGIIFIYDLKKKEITDKIEFGLPGDYEGLAIDGKDAYVLESNGRISEIKNFLDPDRTVDSYETFFGSENNMETLELDVDRNRLLMAPKDRDPSSGRSKGIYAFSLDTKKSFPNLPSRSIWGTKYSSVSGKTICTGPSGLPIWPYTPNRRKFMYSKVQDRNY
jgi:hypothetical protein